MPAADNRLIAWIVVSHVLQESVAGNSETRSANDYVAGLLASALEYGVHGAGSGEGTMCNSALSLPNLENPGEFRGPESLLV